MPELDYTLDIRNGESPDNIHLDEIFCEVGAYNSLPAMQQNYISSNYTHMSVTAPSKRDRHKIDCEPMKEVLNSAQRRSRQC